MKANKLFIMTAFSLLTFQAMSPTELLSNNIKSVGRMPAAEAKKPVAKKPVAKKPITAAQMKALETKLSLLEKDLKNKEALLDQKAKEIEVLKNIKTEEKIEALSKLILEQKNDIDKLRNDIKTSEVKDIKIQNHNHNAVEIIVCKSESKGEKLEADIKKLLEDKESVLKEVQGLKKENDDLKIKLTAEVKPEVKVAEVKAEDKKEEVKVAEVKAEDKKEEKIADKKEIAPKAENPDLISLMSQMTSMFSSQMQAQMQMQIQMMNMLSQMQNNMMPEMSPYSYNPAPVSRRGYSQGGYGSYGGYPATLGQSLDYNSFGLGMQAPTQWSGYSSPYAMPSLNRQPASPTDFGFSFNQPFQGFDFNQPIQAPSQPAFPAIEKQVIPLSAPTFSA